MPRRKKRGAGLGEKRAKKGKSVAAKAAKAATTPFDATPSTPTPPLMKTTTTIIETTTTKKTTTTTIPVANKSPAKKAKPAVKRATALTVAEIPENLMQLLKNRDVQEKVIKFLSAELSEGQLKPPAMAPMEASLAAAAGLDEDADEDNNGNKEEEDEDAADGVADQPSPQKFHH